MASNLPELFMIVARIAQKLLVCMSGLLSGGRDSDLSFHGGVGLTSAALSHLPIELSVLHYSAFGTTACSCSSRRQRPDYRFYQRLWSQRTPLLQQGSISQRGKNKDEGSSLF